MSYRAVFDPPARPLRTGPGDPSLPFASGPALRRPAGAGRRPVTAGLLSGPTGAVPGFLRSRLGAEPAAYGQRLYSGNPVEILGFDPQEDILSLVFEGDAPLPDLSIERDEDLAITALLADGNPIVILHEAGPGFSLRHVAISRHDT